MLSPAAPGQLICPPLPAQPGGLERTGSRWRGAPVARHPTFPFAPKMSCCVLTPRLPAMPSVATGEEVPIPSRPLFSTVSAAMVVVAYVSVLVPIYRFPPMEEKSQCFRLAEAEVSERANEGRDRKSTRLN